MNTSIHWKSFRKKYAVLGLTFVRFKIILATVFFFNKKIPLKLFKELLLRN